MADDTQGPMTPQDFIAKWKGGGDERRDWHSFFDDLCRLVGHKTPREADPGHEWFTYEKGASITDGGDGWADAWKKGFFGWEAKTTGKDLVRAYGQLKMYADALENPPLLIVTDLQKFEIHTNFTNTVKQVHRFTVEDLADHATRRLLQAAFNDPHSLKPGTSRAAITQEAAEKFAALAEALRKRGHEAHAVAHFLNRLLFCMFAEDIGLLPDQLFSKLVDSSQNYPDRFESRTRDLFAAMKDGGDFALNNVEWFNGGLFDDASTLRLEVPELATLQSAARLDWSEIDPSIFGTLFERGLDPTKRSQLGAHYTDPDTIMKLVRPVLIEPWLFDWETEKQQLQPLVAKAKIFEKPATTAKEAAARTKAYNEAIKRVSVFLERLRAFTVLDPACGSGNFLFMALRALKDLEQRVMFEAEAFGLPRQTPGVGPANVRGIELNEYAAELARITIWIGEIQWMIQNGYGARRNPILQPLNQIENRDALLNADGSETSWPEADVIVGNPPFIGDKKMKGELGVTYTEQVRDAYAGRVPGGANFVCYWFEKANDAVAAGHTQRVGLVATNSIRVGANCEVLKHATDTSRIFNAWSDEEWWDKGTAVRVAMICFGQTKQGAQLDGKAVEGIFPNLRPMDGQNDDLTSARKLKENAGAAYLGIQKTGAFEIPGELARAWLKLPNPHGRSNAEVVRPWYIGEDITERLRDYWIIDFGTDMPEHSAAMYEAPFGYAREHVKPKRVGKREARTNEQWWLFQWARPVMRKAVTGLSRYIVTPETPTHTVFEWVPSSIVPDKNLIVIARDDDTTFGTLHSRIHLVWVRAIGSPYGNHPTARRYNSSRVFETYPFPEGLTPNILAKNYETNPDAQRIALAARALVEARDRWLNPAEWTERVPEVVAGFPDRILARTGHEADLKTRTLTNLYNERPAWLENLHRALDEAVASAYGWEWPLSDDEILRRLFELNQKR